MKNCWTHKTHDAFLQSPEVSLLATTMLLEAGGEGELGMEAVAQVIMNRVYDERKRYGNTLKEVILRKKQFSCFNSDVLEKAKKALLEIYNHDSLVDMAYQFCHNLRTCPAVKAATHYYNPKLANPKWADSPGMAFVKQIGNHIFMKEL
ncbi:cell wall hydrolase [Candidatus Magnetobacterium casense]|uniref:Cell wall hydrolase n=1 Tax=Candidatus Magnetobacterium casense TaxID=1455061 RepID=A0ABS6S0U7_9BACT|nr:cell wall hydrolase [Candidatus Magnetobacterium casensis]MBV6342484.1 cell wall hydrolase [Candidatus Magnetobacterium casensis]